ncbi:MAG TPA: DUF4232 domain-containing protein [Marmoricola sp.]
MSSRIRPAITLALGATLAVALTACGSGDDVKGAPAASNTATSASTSPAPNQVASSGPQACSTAALNGSMSALSGAAGSMYFKVLLRNTGSATCTIDGFGGLSFVDADGHQIGAAAVRDTTAGRATVVTLDPGDSAASQVQLGEAANYPKASCAPTQSVALKVYPPNQTQSLQIPYKADACSSTAVKLLQVQPYRLSR